MSGFGFDLRYFDYPLLEWTDRAWRRVAIDSADERNGVCFTSASPVSLTATIGRGLLGANCGRSYTRNSVDV